MRKKLELDLAWEFVADTVMGGVSRGHIGHETVGGRSATRLTGDVSLENNGGFLQMAADFVPDGAFDASDWDGLELDVTGNREAYEVRLKTEQLTRPWQSFRMPFVASKSWETLSLPFADFEAYRTDAAFDPRSLRRIGILAVGRAFAADVAVAAPRLYREA